MSEVLLQLAKVPHNISGFAFLAVKASVVTVSIDSAVLIVAFSILDAHVPANASEQHMHEDSTDLQRKVFRLLFLQRKLLLKD